MSSHPASFDQATAPATRRHAQSVAAIGSVLLGGLCITLTVWAARQQSLARVTHAAPMDAMTAGMIALALVAGLVGVAWLLIQVQPARAVAPIWIIALTWAGLAAGRHVDPTDALAAAMAVVAIGLLALRPGSWFSIGAILGMATGLSPLLVGAAAGVCTALPRSLSVRRFLAGVGLGFLAMAVVGASCGRAPWDAVSRAVLLDRLGAGAVWHHLAALLDLVAAVLVLGALGAAAAPGAVKGDPGQDRSSLSAAATAPHAGDAQSGKSFDVHRTLRVWFFFNLIVAVMLPKVCAAHVPVVVAPAVLLVGAGWAALRTLAVPGGSLVVNLLEGSCRLLVVVLLWVPIRTAGEAFVVAVWPPV